MTPAAGHTAALAQLSAEPTPAPAAIARAPRRLLAFVGPGYLVAVGYMDPGNWATSIAAGSAFGYTLLWVVLVSSLMAMLFQHLSARLGLASGLTLAQACRRHYSKRTATALWVGAEIAICACDLAEVIGAAIALKLLFGLPLSIGILVTVADVFLILLLLDRGARAVEALIMGMVCLIGASFAYNLWLAAPAPMAVLHGFLPGPQILSEAEMLLLAVGIVGATVMPHNLYLHSALVQRRQSGACAAPPRAMIRYATWDSCIALTVALAINCAILILAAAAFNANGRTGVVELEQAHRLLAPLLGAVGAGPAFAIALLCAGVASTFTGTLAGQVVMEGFLNLRIPAWLRRLTTRLIALAPALLVTLYLGEEHTARLLVLSQVVLSLQLPFALFPLIRFTAAKSVMGDLAAPRAITLAAWTAAALIVSLNLAMLWRLAT